MKQGFLPFCLNYLFKMVYCSHWPHRLTARTNPSQGLNRSSILREVTDMFEFFKRNENPPKKHEKILPSDVRYALQYKEGLLNKEDVKILAESNFLNEATYLTFKSLIDDKEKHKELLEKFVNCILNENSLVDKKEIQKELVVKTLQKQEGEIAVKGNKLAQLSRQGFDLWQEKFKELSQRLSIDERNVYVLAHSTFVGLHSFIKEFAEKKKDLNILVPEWEGGENFGYNISFSEGKITISWLHGKLTNDKDSVLVDDTKNTGNTIEQSREFLAKQGLKNIEVIVLDKAS